jgi:hypothetical protein
MDRLGREQFLQQPPATRLEWISAGFVSVAGMIERRAEDGDVTAEMARIRQLCEWAVEAGAPKEAGSLLAHLQTALGAWHDVWPRLGRQADFRRAVTREAGLWSRRLTDATQQR